MMTLSSPAEGPLRKNLVALARPYFGLIVLTTLLAAAFGLLAMFQMPSGIYPEVAFPRIAVIASSPGLAVKDVEWAVTRPMEEAVSVVLGVRPSPLQEHPRGRRDGHRFRRRHRHGPGARTTSGADGRNRRPASRGHQH